MDVKDILARLGEGQHSRSASASASASRQPSYQPPTVSSPIPDTQIQTPEPRHGDVLSVNVPTPPVTENALLGLLKFGNSNQRSASKSQAVGPLNASASTTLPIAASRTDTLVQDLLKRQTASPDPQPVSASPSSPFTFRSPFENLSKTVAESRNTQDVTGKENAKQDPKEAITDALSRVAQEVDNDAHEALSKAAVATSSSQVAERWDDSDNASIVRVFNFPMKPFTSIRVNPEIQIETHIRHEILMKIASFKKEFDQVDRSLAAATPQSIVYCAAKGGGARLIRQADGANKVVFKGTENQMFNVAIGSPDTTVAEPAEPLLATGVNGCVYWTSIPTTADAELATVDDRGFTFPPATSQEDPSSTAQLKTRAKLSSRHPDFFAVGRGKSIHIIWPQIAKHDAYFDATTRAIDSDKYLRDRCLKIATGKAGKDFAFSQDDTLIVTLDKVGRLKFWDIRPHTDYKYVTTTSPHDPVEVKVPLMTLWAASPTEKSSPTSVLFVDKERPMSKGYALRYMLVGFKQNHTIQLWDLCLGKTVQEINLPHSNENDAICSIAYHAKSGMIIVGHPTRNSIYLIHLSAPRYNLPTSLSQADFVARLESGDAYLPKPESTSIMSGMRELSFASIGELRALDAFPPPPADADSVEDADTVFEIYAMHSKGVTCLHMKQSDLGWGPDGKTVSPSDAEAAQLVRVEILRTPPPISETSSGDAPATIVENGKRSTTKDTSKSPASSAQTPASAQTSTSAVTPNGTEKRKKAEVEPQQPSSTGLQRSLSSYADAVSKSPVIPEPVLPEPVQSTVISQGIDTEALNGLLSAHFEKLQEKIDTDKRTMDAVSHARQDAIIRLVGVSLNENTDKVLNKIVTKNITESVVPAVKETVKQSIDTKLPKLVAEHMDQVVAQELKKSLDQAVSKALQDQRVLKTLSEQVVSKISGRIDADLKSSLGNSLTPAFNKLAADAGQTLQSNIESRVAEQLQASEAARQKDSATISTLLTLVGDLTNKVEALTQQVAKSHVQPSAPAPLPAAAPNDPEAAEIKALLDDPQEIQAGLLKWLQSTRRHELFESSIINENLSRMIDLQPVVALSILATIIEHVENQTDRRLEWIQHIATTSNVQDEELRHFSHQVLPMVSSRLQDLYMTTSESSPGSPILSRIAQVHKIIRDTQKLVS